MTINDVNDLVFDQITNLKIWSIADATSDLEAVFKAILDGTTLDIKSKTPIIQAIKKVADESDIKGNVDPELESNDAIDKESMDELKFLYISSMLYPEMFQLHENLGSFVHYNVVFMLAIVVDHSAGEKEFVRKTFSSLTNLMTIEKYNLNLLMFIKLLTINDFNYNIPYDPNDANAANDFKITSQLESIHLTPCLRKMKKLYKEIEQSTELDRKMTDIPRYSNISPCLELANHKECTSFCQWFSTVMKNVPKDEVLTLMR